MIKLDYSEFEETVERLAQLGANTDKIDKKVIDAGSEQVKKAIENHRSFPRSNLDKDHAKDNITISKLKKSRKGNRYRVVGALESKYRYLYYLENGTRFIIKKSFTEKIKKDSNESATEAMKKALIEEINKYLK